MADISVIARSWKADVEHLDPVQMLPRLIALSQDPRYRGKYYANSAARSGIHQAALYRGWVLRLPGFNPANPPGLSKHEYDIPGRPYAEAVDFGIYSGKGGTWAELHRIASDYGFYFPYAARKKRPEAWHGEIVTNPMPLHNQLKSQEDDMPDEYVDAVMAPSGRGAWILKRDGAVETKNFDERNPIPHFGSMHNFPADRDKPGRYFIAIKVVTHLDKESGQLRFSDDLGYFLVSNDHHIAKFDPDTLKKR